MRKQSVFLFIWLVILFVPCQGAVIMSAGQDDGYSGRVMDRIVAKWSPPKQLKNEHNLKLLLSLDGDGKVLDCKVRKSSGLEALDVSACAAARSAAPFGQPPYGMPAEIFLSFWSGGPGSAARADPDKPVLDVSAAQNAREQSQAASERARALAETAAAKTGKKPPAPAKVATAGKQEASTPKAAIIPAKSDTPAKVAVVDNQKPAVKPVAAADKPVSKSETTVAASVKQTEDKKSAKNGQDTSIQPEQDKYDSRYQKYLSRVTWNLRNAMFVPVESKPGTYYATVRLKCDKAGKITSSAILDSSGDETMDRYILQGIKRAGHISPPPAGLGNEFDLTFKMVR